MYRQDLHSYQSPYYTAMLAPYSARRKRMSRPASRLGKANGLVYRDLCNILALGTGMHLHLPHVQLYTIFCSGPHMDVRLYRSDHISHFLSMRLHVDGAILLSRKRPRHS